MTQPETSDSRMVQSIRTRLNQIGWQLDLIRCDASHQVSAEFVRIVYEAEGKVYRALDLLGGSRKRMPLPHRYQESTPPPE